MISREQLPRNRSVNERINTGTVLCGRLIPQSRPDALCTTHTTAQASPSASPSRSQLPADRQSVLVKPRPVYREI